MKIGSIILLAINVFHAKKVLAKRIYRNRHEAALRQQQEEESEVLYGWCKSTDIIKANRCRILA